MRIILINIEMNPEVNLNQPDSSFHGLITHIDGDLALKRKLMSLGLRKGQEVSILHQRHNGVVVLSNGNRIALGEKIAALIFLQPLELQQV
jgi:Fe2+ transport system protein FeoA